MRLELLKLIAWWLRVPPALLVVLLIRRAELSPDSTDRAAGEGDFCAGVAAAANGLMEGPCRCASDPITVGAAVRGIHEAAGGKGDVISVTEPADFATVSAEGRARHTDRELVGLIWICSLV